MISPEDKQHLMNIAEAIDEIQGYVQGEQYEDFFQDDMSKEAVARLLQDVGAASKMLSEDFKAQYGDVDWDAFTTLEGFLYNADFDMENEALWSIIKEDLPYLKEQVTDLAANIREEDDIQGFDLTKDPMTH